MEIVILLGAAILLVVGFVGCIIPVIPGLPLCYAGLLLLSFSMHVDISLTFLVLWAVVVIAIQVLDFYLPVWGTKKYGGTKYGMWGSTIGLIAGMFFSPIVMIIGAFAGAFIGEKLANKDNKTALKAAFGSFMGLLLGTVIKLAIAIYMIGYYCIAVWKIIAL
ncbi:MAG: DUF456 domain-containing protein [Lentimicrobiaceae bacterium]|jgi:uncharacterized protein YqgC (DUF456 family)|nr:DUF456 domain-containing protein [Lentimicrobiaceae bacterium]